jgi:hypothetical protein
MGKKFKKVLARQKCIRYEKIPIQVDETIWFEIYVTNKNLPCYRSKVGGKNHHLFNIYLIKISMQT